MPSNDFLPFATGAGANVLDQASYAALAALATGFVSGEAVSPQLNKVWRQAAFIAAAHAEFVKELTNLDVLDDGDLAGLVAKMRQAIAAAVPRPQLDTTRTIYVSPSGSDTLNDGTSARPFQTIQHAYNYAIATFDFGGNTVTLQLANGVYSNGLSAGAGATGALAQCPIIIQGDVANPASVQINTSGQNCFSASANGAIQVQGVQLKAVGTAGGYCLSVDGGTIQFQNVIFMDTDKTHIYAVGNGRIVCIGPYTISGGAQYHALSEAYIRLSGNANVTIQLLGTPDFSLAFAGASQLGVLQAPNNVFVGSATGVRYSASLNSLIYTEGGGASYFPGNAAGILASGSLYV